MRRPKDSCERLCESPKDKLRRAGSTKFRRRGFVLLEGGHDSTELDSLSEQLHNLKSSDGPLSESELTPKHTSRRRKTNSLDKNEFCTDPAVQTDR